MTRFRLIVFLFTCLAAAVPARIAAAAELVMVEQAGCEWCDAWDREVAPAYARSREGRIAPLRRIDIRDPLPDDLKFIRALVYTPTFVLVNDGREVGRILGYPGEDFFWGLLEQLLEKLPAKPASQDRAGQLPAKSGQDKTQPEARG